jgi:hypothetical protein
MGYEVSEANMRLGLVQKPNIGGVMILVQIKLIEPFYFGKKNANNSCLSFRGGSWNDNAGYVRSADRDWYTPTYRDDYVGLRVSRI